MKIFITLMCISFPIWIGLQFTGCSAEAVAAKRSSEPEPEKVWVDPNAPKLIDVDGVKCVIAGGNRYKKAALAISCNWDQYNQHNRG